jgi:3-hydroxyisobutyrate dehydrogenase
VERFETLAPGAIWVQMSTIGVVGIERVADLVEVERPDVTLLDAPVSGSRDPAEQGQLTIFASGPEQVRPRVTPSSTRLATAPSGSARSGRDRD